MCEARPANDATFREPHVDELLDDPLVELLRRADGLSRDDLRAQIRATRRILAGRGEADRDPSSLPHLQRPDPK